MLSKALVVGAYQRKLEELARCGDIELTCVVPPSWRGPGGEQRLERAHTTGYRLLVRPIRLNGQFHLFHWVELEEVFAAARPEIVHVDEEPYNLATALALRLAERWAARALFFTWQNLYRRYPPPFSLWERAAYRRAAWALAGNREAVAVLRRKGYRGPISVIPQFGVDPALFQPRPRPARAEFVVGYAGRLVAEKGLLLLLDAVRALTPPWRLELVGGGPLAPALQQRAAALGIADRVRLRPAVPSTAMPAVLAEWDALALPSLTRPNWKEQFGRILIEAMACGVPCVGSTCGEIPHVLGDAGLVVPEGDAAALGAALARLQSAPALRARLAERGRARVLAHYTQQRVAERTYAVYRRLMGAA